ncbi:MAG: hypothetical protein QOE06_1489 [Thermoleophilaceae bacterium]|nr:hypothetical protein [Thermoleophilaceae bacterium]
MALPECGPRYARPVSRRVVLPAAAFAVALVVAGVLLLTAGPDTVPLSTVANAAEATNDSGGFKLTIDGRYILPGNGRALPMKGSGALDPQHRRGHLVFNQAGALGGGGTIEQIFQGDVIYMKTPAAAAQFGAKKPWLRVDVKQAGQALGIDPSRLGQMGGNDPRQMLNQIRSVTGDVEKLGTEKVRGVETTKYRGNVDIRRYPDRLPETQREQARVEVEKLVQQTGSGTYPMTLWIGKDKLVRRVRIEYGFDIPGQKQQGRFSMTMEFYDFGAPIDVAPPPAKDVQDLAQLAGQFAAGGGQGGAAPGGQGGVQPAQPGGSQGATPTSPYP